MKRIFFLVSGCILIGYSSGISQDASSSPSPTPAVADPNATDIPPSPTPLPIESPTLGQPATTAISIYRKVAKVGILEVTGSEITLPGITAPVTRLVSWQNGHIDVTDIAVDGSTSTTSWDVSSLLIRISRDRHLKRVMSTIYFKAVTMMALTGSRLIFFHLNSH